jgi:hypothetical protein
MRYKILVEMWEQGGQDIRMGKRAAHTDVAP